MIERTVHGDVTAYRLSWWRSRLIGYGVHVYVVRGAMIDAGYPAARRDVGGIIDAERVRGAFITHQHEDHAGNVPWMARRGVPLAMDTRTEAAIRQPHHIGLYRRITWRNMSPLAGAFPAFADDALGLVYAPGHSPDHHVVWDAETGTLFAGDLFLGVRVRTAHWYEDPHAHVRSLRALVAREPARVFCAHRGLLPNGGRLLAAKADWIEERIAHAESLAREGLDVSTIRERVLGPRGGTHWFSAGDYSPDHLIRAMLTPAPASPWSPPGPHAHQ